MPTTRPIWLVQPIDVQSLLVLSDTTAFDELCRLVGHPAAGRGCSWRALRRSFALLAGAVIAVVAVIAMYVFALMQMA